MFIETYNKTVAPAIEYKISLLLKYVNFLKLLLINIIRLT